MIAKVPINRFKDVLGELAEEYPEAKEYFNNHPDDYPLPMREPPISCTFVKFNDVVVVDPSLDEEEIAQVRLTVATDSKGNIRAMQKGLNGSFTIDEIKKIIKEAHINGKGLRDKLNQSVGR